MPMKNLIIFAESAAGASLAEDGELSQAGLDSQSRTTSMADFANRLKHQSKE